MKWTLLVVCFVSGAVLAGKEHDPRRQRSVGPDSHFSRTECYEALNESGAVGYHLSFGANGSYLFAGKRGHDRGVYVVQDTQINGQTVPNLYFIRVPPEEYTRHRDLKVAIPDEPLLHMMVQFNEDSYVTRSEGENPPRGLDGRPYDVTTLTAQKLGDDSIGQKAVLEDLGDRIKSLSEKMKGLLEREKPLEVAEEKAELEIAKEAKVNKWNASQIEAARLTEFKALLSEFPKAAKARRALEKYGWPDSVVNSVNGCRFLWPDLSAMNPAVMATIDLAKLANLKSAP